QRAVCQMPRLSWLWPRGLPRSPWDPGCCAPRLRRLRRSVWCNIGGVIFNRQIAGIDDETDEEDEDAEEETEERELDERHRIFSEKISFLVLLTNIKRNGRVACIESVQSPPVRSSKSSYSMMTFTTVPFSSCAVALRKVNLSAQGLLLITPESIRMTWPRVKSGVSTP